MTDPEEQGSDALRTSKVPYPTKDAAEDAAWRAMRDDERGGAERRGQVAQILRNIRKSPVTAAIIISTLVIFAAVFVLLVTSSM